MRLDKHLHPELILTERQRFFASCWFNMVNRASLDSYRVRAMNPVNILRELLRMHEPQADSADRRRVAEEALEILGAHPLLSDRERYGALPDTIELVGTLSRPGKAAPAQKDEGEDSAISSPLILSFLRESLSSLSEKFLPHCFEWLGAELRLDDPAEGDQSKRESFARIERVCRDLLSVALDEDGSLESLFQYYRLLVPSSAKDAEGPYDFMRSFERVRADLTKPSRSLRVIFVANSIAAPEKFCGIYGNLKVTQESPHILMGLGKRQAKFLQTSPARLFIDAEVSGRDGRAAGMLAYRQIGEIIDLYRFEFDSRSAAVATEFLLVDGVKALLLHIPEIIPNPEVEPPQHKLEEFASNLGKLVLRGSQDQSRDRIFSAFRLYRVGAETDIFENKLVSWWTGVEYLTRGGKSGSIGAGVESALAPALSLAYLAKHLAAIGAIFRAMSVSIQTANGPLAPGSMRHQDLYSLLRDPAHEPELRRACSRFPYEWHQLSRFMGAIRTPSSVAAMLRGHDKRLRWQIQRIYRARCDIVHSGKLVVNASLLCANLEYYLRVTLTSMLRTLQGNASLLGPAEFFDRAKYHQQRIFRQLEAANGASDGLLLAHLD